MDILSKPRDIATKTVNISQPLTAKIDRAELLATLDHLFVEQPELFREVGDFFLREGAPYEPSALVDYLFVVTDGPTSEAGYPIVGLRLRDANERRAARAALDRSKKV